MPRTRALWRHIGLEFEVSEQIDFRKVLQDEDVRCRKTGRRGERQLSELGLGDGDWSDERLSRETDSD